MKKNIHPTSQKVIFKDTNSDFALLTRSTLSSPDTIQWEDGQTYPLVKVEVSSVSHPFYTGKRVLLNTSGKVQKFMKKYNIQKK